MATVSQVLAQGWRLHQAGDLAAAVTLYQQVLQAHPQNANALCYLGIALYDLGQFAESERAYRRALAIQPEFPIVLSNLANTLGAMGRLQDALQSVQQALQLKPDYANAWTNLGSLQVKLGQLDEATVSFQRALQLAPDSDTAHRNLGATLVRKGDLEQGLASSRDALRINPANAEAHKNQAIVWLLSGQFDKGWPEYEWRWKCPGMAPPAFSQPRWDGSPLKGRTILLHAEQGLGDTLHFVRYAPLIQAAGDRVVVQCQPALVAILQRTPGIDALVARGAALPAFDVHAPLVSVPGILHTRLETIPANVPYLFADPQLVERWRGQLPAAARLRIGIAWQGSPDHHSDLQRSVPLSYFRHLAGVEGVQLISLQKGYGCQQVAELEGAFPLTDLGDQLDASGAFTDTAAIMQHLDLVVTSDTAVAHLAGGLGVAVWVALCNAPDWRWLLQRSDSPWYPTMRLFRQTSAGDWEGVFQQMRQALQDYLVDRPGAPLICPVVAASPGSPPPDVPARAVTVEIPPGELIDKITILQIKSERIEDQAKQHNVRIELQTLSAARQQALPQSQQLADLERQLRRVNESLWDIEDAIRQCESAGDFGPRFIELARSVYHQNDERAALKRQINELLGSRLIEEKSYFDYRRDAGP